MATVGATPTEFAGHEQPHPHPHPHPPQYASHPQPHPPQYAAAPPHPTQHVHARAHQHQHQHQHFAPPQPPPPPPPALPRRRGPTLCACSLACVFCCGLAGFVGMVAVELPYVAYETTTMLQQRRVHAVRAGAAEGTHRGVTRFGLWDERLAISPLQLTVALSMSLDVAEERVHVASSGDSFFDVRIDGEAGWLVEAVNGPMFLPALNGQASVFGAKLVIAHAAAAAAALAPSPNRTAPGAR